MVENRAQSAEQGQQRTFSACQQAFARIASLQATVDDANHTEIQQAARITQLEGSLAAANEACAVHEEYVKTLEDAVEQARAEADLLDDQLAVQTVKFNELQTDYRKSDAQNATLHLMLEDSSAAATKWASYYQHELASKDKWLLAAEEYMQGLADNEHSVLQYIQLFDATNRRADRLQDQASYLTHWLRVQTDEAQAREEQNAATIKRL